MATRFFREGAILPFLWKTNRGTSLGAMTSIVPLACTITYDASTNNNDRRSLLEAGAQYQFILGLQGEDATRKGYTITAASQGSGVASVTTPSTEGVLLTVAASAWGSVTNSSNAQGVQIWMKKGSSTNYYLHSIVPVDTSVTFQTVVFTEADSLIAPAATEALLQAATSDDTLGTRAALGGGYTSPGTTQGGITIEDTTDEINFSPDTATDYAYAITRGMTVTFSTLNNSMADIVKARAGEFVRFTDAGIEYQQANMIFQAASAVSTGNAPLKLVYPVDENRSVEQLVMYCSITQNQRGGSQQWGKQDPVVIDYTFDTINQDTLLQGIPAVTATQRRVL